jgi:hypothetical protein
MLGGGRTEKVRKVLMPDTDRRGVFLSWSQPVAAEIATHLKPFLEDVLGTATIFMSQAMEGGTRWSMEIPQRLESCNAGLVLVTQENSQEPWLHFEAGALSKQIEESRVVPLLCGSTVGDIQGTPLSLFQAKNLDHDDFLSVCVAFGNAFAVGEEAVRRRFEKSWPDLEAAVAKVKGAAQPKGQIALADLMAVLERVAAQVASIENNVRPSGALAAYSGNPFATRANTIGGLLAASESQGLPITFKGVLAQLLENERNALRANKEKDEPAPPKPPGKKKDV